MASLTVSPHYEVDHATRRRLLLIHQLHDQQPLSQPHPSHPVGRVGLRQVYVVTIHSGKLLIWQLRTALIRLLMVYPQLHHEVVGEAVVAVEVVEVQGVVVAVEAVVALEAGVDVEAGVDGTAGEVVETLSLNRILRIVAIVLLPAELLDQQG